MLNIKALLHYRHSFLLILFAIIVCFTGVAQAQSVIDGFDPNANGNVNVVVVQPDGKILIGGDFTTLAPNGGAAVTRNRIARLNADGTLDTAFNPNANGGVVAIAVQPDGKILAGGSFTSIGAQTRNRFARLDAVTGLADSFDPNASNAVRAIAVQTDGKIIAGGDFTVIGGQTRNRIARLDAATGMTDSFDPNANFQVLSIAIQPDGKVLAGGAFNGANSIGGQTRNCIARLDPVTGLPDSFNPNANNAVFSIALQADGKVLAGGFFTTIGALTRTQIARLDATTGAADSWNPNANGDVLAIAIQTDGKILAGGGFTTIGGQTRNRIARLDPTTGSADSFNPNANNSPNAIALQSDGKILIGGVFTQLTPNGAPAITRNRIARFESASGYSVNTTSDTLTIVANACVLSSAQCTLRAAITRANAGSDAIIRFNIPATDPLCSAGVCTINLMNFLPAITDPVTIGGPGANRLTVRRNNAGNFFRIFDITTANRITTISGLTVSNGSSEFGSGIRNGSGQVNIVNCTINGNSGSGVGQLIGFGGSMNITGSTISNNTGSGVINGGIMHIINSTINGNLGSGIFNRGIDTVLTLTNSTITNNSTTMGTGGGVINQNGTVQVKSTIIALNTAGTGPDVNGFFASAGFNLIGKRDTGNGFTEPTDQTGTIAARDDG